MESGPLSSDQKTTNLGYSLKDWLADWTWILTWQQQVHQKECANVDWVSVVDYFDRKYHRTADFHRERMFAALRYLEKHADEVNEGRLGIAGKRVSAIGRPFVQALWVIYSQTPDDHLKDDWPTAEVLELARKLDRIP